MLDSRAAILMGMMPLCGFEANIIFQTEVLRLFTHAAHALTYISLPGQRRAVGLAACKILGYALFSILKYAIYTVQQAQSKELFMPDALCPSQPMIQIDSPDPIWEWHVPSDRLFLSRGARRQLNLDNDAPESMAAFLTHIPPDCLPMLHDLVEGVLSGANGSYLEMIQPFDHLLVRVRLLIAQRNAEGRAVRVIGHYGISENQAYQPPLSGGDAPGAGYWHCSLSKKCIHMDSRCAELLGYADPRPLCLSTRAWRARLHPEEGSGIACRYQLTIEESQFGDIIDDEVRIRLEDGQYARFSVHGAVLARSPEGRALQLSGSLSRLDVSQSSVRSQSQDTGRLLLAISATGDGLWDWDSQTDEVYYSPRYLSMLGYTAEQFPGTLAFWKTKIHPDDYHKIVPPQAALVKSPRYGDTFECTYRLMRADGTWAWILGRGWVTHRDGNGRATRIVGLHTDITSTQSDRAELEDLVRNDTLTGLRSRNFCTMEMARIEQSALRPVSVIVCDVNGLKLINDYLGHNEGDRLLREMALMLRHCLRATDCIARMGGDEFTILLPGCSRRAGEKILAQILTHFEEYNTSGKAIPILAAFGLASAEDMTTSLSQTAADADRAMLRDKHARRGAAHQQIKNWIEHHKNVIVSLEDSRYF